ncbi:MAG TPA: hypothetical protein VGR37_12465 [Longimicrobiaceae bacterium]|nr:hypothetical protein [Longimicrobiaceae bacterium]
MATLEISLNCLCLFVPDPDPQKHVVHVLLPASSAGHHPHVARVLHPKNEEKFKDVGLPLEGWVLKLGDVNGASADTDLRPKEPPKNGDQIFDITDLAGKLKTSVITDPAAVVSRVELRAGGVKELKADAVWEINGVPVAMAHRVTWEIPDFTADKLDWAPQGGNGGNPPFTHADLMADDGGVFTVNVFHVTEDALPPNDNGTLNPTAVRHHFLEFYRLYGIGDPGETKLPKNPRKIKSSRGRVGRVAAAAREGADPEAIEALANFAEQIEAAFHERGGVAGVLEAFRAIENYNCPTIKGRFG